MEFSRNLGFLFALTSLGLVQSFLFPAPAPSLESYNVDPNTLTVSGISSGGLMSPQLHFIFSSEVKGAGIFAGGPYLCGNNVAAAALCFLTPELQNVQDLITLADSYDKAGKINSLSNIAGSKVYIFAGLNDTVAKPQAGHNLHEMYAHYGANVKGEFSIAAQHGQPVNNGLGGPCGSVNPQNSYVNECAYNGVYEMFKWLYGDGIVPPAASFRGDGDLLKFNQNEFIQDPLISGMSDTGEIYIPKNCANKTKQCRVHVALHGCLSNGQFIGDDFAKKTQYIDTAEKNDIIVIFPQTTITLNNVIVCWDWVGSTGPAFATNTGSQPRAIHKMMKRVLGQD